MTNEMSRWQHVSLGKSDTIIHMHWVVTRLFPGCVRPRPVYLGRVCVDLMRLGVWPFVGLFCLLLARVCCAGVWFGFVWSALLLAVGTCIVLLFEAIPGLCCFLRVTQSYT